VPGQTHSRAKQDRGRRQGPRRDKPSKRSAAAPPDPLERILPVTFLSKTLKQRRNVLVYLPPDYASTRRHYPILYLLHGMHGSEIDWVLKGKVHLTLDEMIGSGRIGPLLVAMPNDGLYDAGTFYVDWYDGTGRFERYFLREVMAEVSSAVRVRRGRNSTAIAGLSMGGYGALTLSLRHPGMFCAAFGPKRPEGVSYRKVRDPRHLVTLPRTRSVALHLNCGRSDFLLQQNRKFHALLERIGRDHEYMEFPGGHTWDYWQRHIVEVLLFVDRQSTGRSGRLRGRGRPDDLRGSAPQTSWLLRIL